VADGYRVDGVGNLDVIGVSETAKVARLPADDVRMVTGEDGNPKLEGAPAGYELVHEYEDAEGGPKKVGTFLQPEPRKG
jgi:hypothetical protein